MGVFISLIVLGGLLATGLYLFENSGLRFFLTFVPIFIIILALVYSRIQSELRILFLVVRNVLKSVAKQRLNSAPDNHQAVFLGAYRGKLLAFLLLMIFLAFVSYQLSLLILPSMMMTLKGTDDVGHPVLTSGTLYAVAWYLLFLKNSFQIPPENLKAVEAVAWLFLAGVAFFFSEAFILIMGAEVAVLDWFRRNKPRR